MGRLLGGVTVLALALALRLAFQAEAQSLHIPFQADARKYFSIAFNWKNYGSYSHRPFWESPRGETPEPSGIRPGYPLFLLPFVPSLAEMSELGTRLGTREAMETLARPVRLSHVWMGSLSALLTYLLALRCLRPGWALAAGLLSAGSPHLIATEYHLLTETFFVFVMLASLLLFCAALRRESRGLAALSGLAFGFLGLIRTIGFLLGPWLALLFLLRGRPLREVGSRQLAPFLLAYSLMGLGWQVLHADLVRDAPVGTTHTTLAKELWNGSDIDLAGKRAFLADRSLGLEVRTPDDALRDLSERPAAFLRWYLWGKLHSMWQWNTVHTGSLHIYALERSPFESQPGFAALEAFARALHAPMLLLAAAAPVVIFLRARRRRGDAASAGADPVAWVPAMALLYFVMVLWLLVPMPRYTIPARPLLFITALGSLAWLARALVGRVRPAQAPSVPDSAKSSR